MITVADRTVMTTGDVARRLHVSVGTVAKWCDRGLIKFWLVPGSRHKRFARADVEEFARVHGVPSVSGDVNR